MDADDTQQMLAQAGNVPATPEGIWMFLGAAFALLGLVFLVTQIWVGMRKIRTDGRMVVDEPIVHEAALHEVKGRMMRIEDLREKDLSEIKTSLRRLADTMDSVGKGAYDGRKTIYTKIEALSHDVADIGRELGERIARIEGLVEATSSPESPARPKTRAKRT